MFPDGLPTSIFLPLAPIPHNALPTLLAALTSDGQELQLPALASQKQQAWAAWGRCRQQVSHQRRRGEAMAPLQHGQ